MNKRIPSYVLNDFLKFDRKIYRLFGLKLGRSIQFKTILYFLGFCAIEFVIYLVPVIGWPLRSLPFVFLLMIPGVIAYLLTDVGTENRSPLSFFRTYFSYQIRKLKKVTYYRGKELEKPKTYAFGRTLTYKEYEKEQSKEKSGKPIRLNGYLTYRK
ncbi:TcpE family conjugal transfer membrane protein [Peribacillus frigoritolerans]|uniref:TcpE family conjugal transfer membrane protein n=1 Tax=Peribacillus frigoritolerans TaxID=450367 RepID=UPI0039A3D610